MRLVGLARETDSTSNFLLRGKRSFFTRALWNHAAQSIILISNYEYLVSIEGQQRNLDTVVPRSQGPVGYRYPIVESVKGRGG
jgi:hypothetical protein